MGGSCVKRVIVARLLYGFSAVLFSFWGRSHLHEHGLKRDDVDDGFRAIEPFSSTPMACVFALAVVLAYSLIACRSAHSHSRELR
jgi:hypothetical protein